jgi:cobalt/nickel transport system ATP-binding protein
VSFALAPGENAALIGANGAGKTSLLLALVGVLPAAGGEISVGGVTMNKKTLREIRSRVGLVFQNPDDQLFMPNIFEDAAFGPRSYGCDEAETARRVDSALASLGIERLRDRSPLKLSGGEKRLCAIATVLAMRPEYLLFDEPSAFLDPRARRKLIAEFARLPQGKLIATHDLDFAEKTCSRVLLIGKGKIVADGGRELLRDADLLESAGL